MKKIKWFLIITILLSTVGGSVYLPMRMHVVRYDSKFHWVKKHQLSYDDTYLNLDNESSKWFIVLKSPTLRAYFAKHYSNVLYQKTKKKGVSLLEQLKQKSKAGLNKITKTIKRQITKERINHLKKQGQKGLKTLKNKASKGYNHLKQSGQKAIKKLQE